MQSSGLAVVVRWLRGETGACPHSHAQPAKVADSSSAANTTGLIVLADAAHIDDPMQMRSDRFSSLGGERNGQYSIRVNEQWRICFRFEDKNASDVEIIDYRLR